MSDPLNKRSKAEVSQLSSAGVVVDGKYNPPPKDKDGKIWVRTSALIHAEPGKLYRMWRDVENAS